MNANVLANQLAALFKREYVGAPSQPVSQPARRQSVETVGVNIMRSLVLECGPIDTKR